MTRRTPRATNKRALAKIRVILLNRFSFARYWYQVGYQEALMKHKPDTDLLVRIINQRDEARAELEEAKKKIASLERPITDDEEWAEYREMKRAEAEDKIEFFRSLGFDVRLSGEDVQP